MNIKEEMLVFKTDYDEKKSIFRVGKLFKYPKGKAIWKIQRVSEMRQIKTIIMSSGKSTIYLSLQDFLRMLPI
jgi:hypothetical protein